MVDQTPRPERTPYEPFMWADLASRELDIDFTDTQRKKLTEGFRLAIEQGRQAGLAEKTNREAFFLKEHPEMSRLLSTIESDRTKLSLAVEALTFYADEKNYESVADPSPQKAQDTLSKITTTTTNG